MSLRYTHPTAPMCASCTLFRQYLDIEQTFEMCPGPAAIYSVLYCEDWVITLTLTLALTLTLKYSRGQYTRSFTVKTG